MKKSEIIHILKEPLSTALSKLGDKVPPTFASNVIAYCLYLYDKKEITDINIKDDNNPFGTINPSTGQKNTYSSIEECILLFSEDTIKDEEFLSKYDYIAKANNLYRFDKEHLENNVGSLIDLDDEKASPNFDMYTVKDSDGTEIGKTSKLEDAKKMKATKNGNTISNSRNEIIDGVVRPTASKDIVSLTLKPGAKVICNNMNLYYKPYDTKPGRVINGEYCLYNGKEINGRYAICISPTVFDKSLSLVLGYVNAYELKK